MATPDPALLRAALERLESREASAQDQRRRFRRFDARGEAILVPADPTEGPENALMTSIRDIGRGGMGVVSDQACPIGRSWQVQLLSGGLALATVPGFCRHVSPVTSDAWLLGIEFGVDASILVGLGIDADRIIHGEWNEDHGGASEPAA